MDSRTNEILRLIQAGSTQRGIARELDIPRTTLRRIIKRLKESDHFEAAAQEPDDLTVDEIRELKLKISKRKKQAHFADATQIRIKPAGPIGILHFGDPHLDDDGTDWEALERDIKLVKETDGLLAGNLGDTTNNWVGRLTRLYGDQTTTARQAFALARWFIEELAGKLVYMIGGNHDMWSGASDPLQWFMAQAPGVYKAHQAKLALNFPNGRSITMRAHHQFKGHSQWNTAHSIAKSATMGFRNNLLLAGHRHISGYQQVVDPSSGLISHCVQVGSYKVVDDYPLASGMMPNQISPSVVTIIDPDATRETALIQVFTDTELAADILSYLRRKTK